VVYTARIQRRESGKLLRNGQRPLYFQAEVILPTIDFKFHYQANNRSNNADGFYHSIINDKDGSIPLPLIMFAWTAFCHTLVEWQTNKRIHLKASKSTLKADRPDHANCFNYKNDGGKITSCCIVTGDKLLTSPGVADMYTFSMNTWNTLPESYQQWVYKITSATVKYQI